VLHAPARGHPAHYARSNLMTMAFDTGVLDLAAV
jgi:hypothetical protein